MAKYKENNLRIFHMPFLKSQTKKSTDKLRKCVNLNNNKLKYRSKSISSIISISEVTQGACEVWATLPDEIRKDPSLASFRQEHERIHGK